MKKIISFAAAAAFGTSAFAQLATLPPSSTVDGVPVQGIGVNAGASHWESSSTLGAYRYASDNGTDRQYTKGTVDSNGVLWDSFTPAAVTGYVASINSAGGFIRAIFTGETAGWLNDFGYAYSGIPSSASSYTVFTNIQALSPATVSFGDYIDLSFAPHTASTFDFWLNGVGGFGPTNPTPPTADGGVFTVFNQTNSTPYIAPGQVLWSQAPILVNTWVPSMSAYENVATYLVTVEDWRIDSGSDHDYSDFTFALQFYDSSDKPFAPVPEPSTYGLVGGAALLGLIVVRRLKQRSSKG